MAHKKKQSMAPTITIDNAAQYNNEGERLCVSLQTWIYACLQTDKWAWLHIHSQKVGVAHKEVIANYYTYTSSN